MLTRMIDKLREEINASDLFDVEISTTPYTIIEMTVSEDLKETFLAVDVSNLSSDRVIQPSNSYFMQLPYSNVFFLPLSDHVVITDAVRNITD